MHLVIIIIHIMIYFYWIYSILKHFCEPIILFLLHAGHIRSCVSQQQTKVELFML